jgi:hypothetical protein
MADRKKFEEMLNLLVNEDREAAAELFHEIVVEKSRDIYESLLEDEADLDEEDDEEVDESEDEEVDESEDEDDEDLDEGFDLDEFEVEADDDDMGGDPTDDMLGDLELDMDDDDMDDDDMDMDDDDMDMDNSDEDIEDRVDDLEDAIEDLKAEFEALMSDDDMDMGDDDMDMDDDDMDMDDGDMDDDDMDDDDMDMDNDEESKESFAYESKKMKKDDKKAKKTAGEEMREYVEKVGGAQYNQYGKMGDNGANTKSAVAGKNDMGGTSQNILRTDTEQGVEANKGKLKGSSLSNQSPKDMSTKNINVPGGKAGKTAFKKSEPGHGAEKKGKPDTADKSATSTLNKVSTRAK